MTDRSTAVKPTNSPETHHLLLPPSCTNNSSSYLLSHPLSNMESNTVNLAHLMSSTFYTGLKGVLDLDSTNIQLDTLGRTPMPSASVKSCLLCFLLAEPYFCHRSLLTVLLQFILGRPDHLSYPGTCHYSACCGMCW